MASTSQLVWGMLFGAVGMGFFVYGKKQRTIIPLIAGIALFVLPYFVGNVYLLVTTGAACMLLPYFVRI